MMIRDSVWLFWVTL